MNVIARTAWERDLSGRNGAGVAGGGTFQLLRALVLLCAGAAKHASTAPSAAIAHNRGMPTDFTPSDYHSLT